MLWGPHKTQGCPKEQPVGEQPHPPWMSWLGTYLAGNVWFTCGDARQTFGKCSCISSVCEESHHGEGKAQVSKHTWALGTGVLIQGPAGALWQQEDLTQIMPQDSSFPLAAHPCHRDGRSRLGTRVLCPLAATAEGQGVKCWMGHLWGGRLYWWQTCATDGYVLFWPALIFLAGPLIARERYRQMQ